jgi:hypothetical protein
MLLMGIYGLLFFVSMIAPSSQATETSFERQAKQIIAALAQNPVVQVELSPDMYTHDKVPYKTFATQDMMKCMTRLDLEFHAAEGQTYKSDLADD